MPLAIRLLAALLSPALAAGAIWPEQFGGAPRTALEPAAAADPLLWSELGFQSGERARYGRFAAAAWRFQDATGAMAAFQSRRPEKAARSQLATLAVETGEGALLAHGNYLLRFDGYKPKPEELAALYARLPRLEQSSLPPLMEYLPESGLVLNSGRYIIGPAGLEAFEPRVPPSVAAFHLGSEAQAGVYRTQGGDMKLAIFSYPTPQIAMERVKEFARIPGAVAKRTGPLVAVILSPPDPDQAERLLAEIRYQAEVTWSEHVPGRRDNIGDLIINIFILIGLILSFMLVASLGFGGFLVWRRRSGREHGDMIVLGLGGRR